MPCWGWAVWCARLSHRELCAISARSKNCLSSRGKNQEIIMNWCTRESHFCVSKHSLKRQHKLPVCYLDEACRSEFRRSSVRAAFQQGGVCSFFSQTATEQDQSLLFSWLAMWFFIISFNGLQHKSCGMKRSWYSEASESKAFLDRTHLYLLSKLYLSPLAFCAAVDSMCKSRKDW